MGKIPTFRPTSLSLKGKTTIVRGPVLITLHSEHCETWPPCLDSPLVCAAVVFVPRPVAALGDEGAVAGTVPPRHDVVPLPQLG